MRQVGPEIRQQGFWLSISFGRLENSSPIAAVYWYTYDNEGNPIFLLGTGTMNGSTLEVDLRSPTGMKYGEFDTTGPPADNAGGVAVFNFSDSENATFSYTPSAFSESNWGHSTVIENLPIQRLFTVPVTESSDSAE